MKIAEITKRNNKFIRLQLIKTQTYKKNYDCLTKISDIMIRLKKSLNIIYKYHINNKRILFVGAPINLNKKWWKFSFNKSTRHVLLPESAWQSGLISNVYAKFSDLFKKNKANDAAFIISSFIVKFDLVVLIDLSAKNSALHEAYLSEIPVISLCSNGCNIFDFKTSYKIPGNFRFTKKKEQGNLFYSVLFATLKKAEKTEINKSLGRNRSKNHFMKGKRKFNTNKTYAQNKTH